MQKRHVVAFDPVTGQARASASVKVLLAGTLTLAGLFADDEVTPLSNPLTADLAGRTAFKTVDGDYDIEVSGAGFTTYTLTDVQVADKDSFQPVTAVVGVHTHESNPEGGQLNASNVFSSGTVPPARLGSGASATTFLAGDSTFKEVSSPRGYIAGYKLANNVGDPNNDVDVASGACRSDDNMEDILLAGTLTKQLDAVWSQGTNLGGLDTGAKAADTFYHVYAIKNPSTDVVDVLLSTSMTPTMPSGFTLKRRLGSVRTDGSSNLLAFSQESDEFLWAAPTLDATNLTVNATAALQAVKVPSGVKVFAILTSVWQGNAAAGLGIISSPDVNDVAPSLTAAPLLTHRTVDATPAGWSTLRVRTNTSAQVRLRGGIATQHLWLCTLGWLDSRGRDA